MKYKYSEKDIKVLSFEESMRVRPRMYVGDMNTKGFTSLLKAILIDFKIIFEYGCVKVELLSTYSGKIKIEGIKEIIDTKWIYYKELELYKIPSTDFYLLELQALKALSTDFTIRSKESEQIYQKGKLIKGSEDKMEINSSTLEIEFILDKQIWGEDFEFNPNYINQEIKEFAFLNKNIKFKLNYFVDNEENKSIYHFKNGLKDKFDIEILRGLGEIYLETYIYEKIADFELEVAFALYEYNVNESIIKSYIYLIKIGFRNRRVKSTSY